MRAQAVPEVLDRPIAEWSKLVWQGGWLAKRDGVASQSRDKKMMSVTMPASQGADTGGEAEVITGGQAAS